MKPRLITAACVLCVVPHGDRPAPRFDVSAYTILEKTFSEKTHWSVEELYTVVDGAESAQSFDSMTQSVELELRVSDEYGATRDGRPESLERSVESATARITTRLEAGGGEESYTAEAESPFAGETIGFEWNDETECYDKSVDESDLATRVARLEEDMDLRFLLPDDEVEEGDEWTVEVERLGALFAPGGDWTYLHDSLPDGDYSLLTSEDVLAASCVFLGAAPAEIAGRAKARWVETRGELALIALEIEVDLAFDLAERVHELADELEQPWSRDDFALDVEWSLKAEGELAWNLESGHLQSLTLDAESGIVSELSWSMDEGLDVGLLVKMSGETKLEARAVEE